MGAATPIGWCVRCKQCRYARYDLGGEIESSCRAIRHMLSARHNVVAWKEGKEGASKDYTYTGDSQGGLFGENDST